MDKLVINGGKRLVGEVKISGSKNSALPILLASVLTDEDVILTNVPNLRDIQTMIKLLEHLGKSVEVSGDVLVIKQTAKIATDAPYDLVRQMRASALVMGPILTRYGHVRVSLPGGCAIGARPINIHLDGFKKLGADLILEEGYVNLSCQKLTGTKIFLDYPSVGATENLIMSTVLAQGTTILENVAKEPEIEDLCKFLNKMGAKISGLCSNKLVIEGVQKLNGTKYSVMSDRIEAGTFMIASAITKGNVLIKNVVPEHLDIIISKMIEPGVKITIENESDLRVVGTGEILPVSIETLPYPGFPTDMQAQWMVFMTQANGSSVITETVFENRFMHVSELLRMGADLTIKANSVFVKGDPKKELSGAPVMATDLRASAGLVLAGLIAKAKTEVLRIYHLDRGYEKIEDKLTKLGADIKRIKE